LPKRVIKRCPAIRLAVSRTQRVIGRIMFLVISITTIKDIKAIGVPWGNKWDSTNFVFWSQPNIIKLSHTDNERGKLKFRCDVTEKIWGYKAIKFSIKIE